MKVLFDVIYSTQPHKCSSSAKFKKIALDLLAARPDAFVYWPIPDWIDETSRAWLPASERIRYVEIPASKDRVREYQVFYRDLEERVAFFGALWDYDVLITMRTAQVPTIRTSMNSPRHAKMGWLKKAVLLEEMAILDFRKTVPVSAPAVQDMQTIAGYLAADVGYITAIHVRDGILQAARGIYAPSKVQELRAKLRLVNPALVEDYSTKAPEHRFRRGQEPFCLGFVGRMSNSMTRLPEVYEVMDKNWIMKGDQGFKVIISTVSTGVKLPPPDFVVFENNPREKFWARVKEDMHLVISMSVDAEFSMSLIEPVLFGTPLVIAREDWTEGLLGRDYPFFVTGKVQAYGMVRAFHDDYETLYERFLEWRETSFKPRFRAGGVYERNLYADVLSEVGQFDEEVDRRMRAERPNKVNNAMVRMIMDKVAGADEFKLFDVLKALADDGAFRNFGAKIGNQDDGLNLTFMTPYHEWKVIFRAFYGYTDASTELGHFRKIAA